MRKAILLLSLVSTTLVIAAALSPASALKVQKVSQGAVSGACGGNAQTGGGHYGCSKKCGNTMCDYDCQTTPIYGHMKNCTKTTIIKPAGGSKTGNGSIRTGGVKVTSGPDKPIRHPVDIGVKNPPTSVKTDPAMGSKHGGMNQSGGYHR